MIDPNAKVSSASNQRLDLDMEDQEALSRVAGSATQDAAPVSPPAGEGQPLPTGNAPTAGALVWAGHALALCNQFFVSRFGAEGALPDAIAQPIKTDLAAAIDAYLPKMEAQPGVFALVALGGHFFACQRNAKPSASSGSPGPEKPHSSSPVSDSERAS